MVPAVVASHVDAAGGSPPTVAMRCTYVVCASRSPSSPELIDVALRRSHGIAVGSTVATPSRLATTLLPSFACHVGPPKWVATSLPLSPYRSARGATSAHGPAPLHE